MSRFSFFTSLFTVCIPHCAIGTPLLNLSILYSSREKKKKNNPLGQLKQVIPNIGVKKMDQKSQIVYNSLFSIELKDNPVKLTAGR